MTKDRVVLDYYWKKACELWDTGARLYDEAQKIFDDQGFSTTITELKFGEGSKAFSEGDILWAKAILAERGNVSIEVVDGDRYHQILNISGDKEVFKSTPKIKWTLKS